MSETTLFQQLRGEQLSAVTFVQDYLQLWFDGPGINVINPLTVHSGGLKVTSGQPGFRDLLCAQIAKVVAEVSYRDGVAFEVRFEDGSTISVSLRKADYTAPEAIYAHGFKDGAAFVA